MQNALRRCFRTPQHVAGRVILAVVLALVWLPAATLDAAATIMYVQSNYADPQSPQTTVTVKYTAAQNAGDLNIVVVGWNDSTSTVAAVTDSKSNTYTRAVGPTVVSGFGSQSIYYAKNIVAASAGANTVSVSFNTAAAFPDIRILEYSGADTANPIDVSAAASGSNTTTNSGSVTTTNATDLIFGANLVYTATTGPGSGFTKRILSSPDHDIAEDKMVSSTGSYSASAPVSPAGAWIMQMVAVRTPSGPDTTPPTAPTNLTATSVGSQINLSWTASTDNIGVTGYLVERCSGAGCTNFAQIGTTAGPTYADSGLATGTYSYRVKATDAAGNLSQYSSTATASITDTQPPTAPANLSATAGTTQVSLTWTASTDNVGVTSYAVERCSGASCTSFAQIGTATVTSYTDANPVPGTYSYRVRASDAAGNLSTYSNTATASIADTQPPTAPTGLTASASGTTVNLAWAASTDNVGVTGYMVERCEGTSCSNFAQLTTTTLVSYKDSNLPIDTFSYRVRATDAAGNLSAYSSVATTTTTATPASYLAGYAFDEGTGTTTADSSGNNITGTLQNATWTMGKFGDGLLFNGTNAYVDLGAAAPLMTTGSMSWEAWVYPTAAPADDGQIVALSNGTGGWQFKTTADTGVRTAGAAVWGANNALAQRYGKTVLSLNNWYYLAGVYNASAQTLDVYINGVLDDGTLSGTVPSSMVLPTGVNVNIGRRTGGFNFIGTIDNVRMYGRALSATEIQNDMNTPVGQPADTQPPTAPTGLAATAVSGSEIDLSWTASTDNVGVKSYLLERCQGAACTNFVQIATPSKTTYNDTGLTPNTTYTYRVRATDAAGNLSGYSNTAPATTLPPAPPAAPGSLTATAPTVNQVNLSWAASTADLGIANYSVERCQGAGCSNFAAIASPTGTTYSDTTVQAGTSYSYRVRAFDTSGTAGPYSNTAAVVTPTPQPPTAPSNLTATAVSSTQINLAWTASTSTLGVANYVVQRCQGSACSGFATIASPTTTTYSDINLQSGNSYTYQVKAVDTAGASSPFSNAATAVTVNGLTAAYGFNEGTGTVAGDASGNAINGTVQAATWTVSGKYGEALSFNGANSYVDLGSPSLLNTTGSFTWEAWVYPTGTPGDDGQIIALSNDTAGWQFKTTQDTGARTFGVGVSGAAGSFTQRYGKTVLNLNTWYHVAGVYNASARTLDIYVNGALDDGTLSGVVPAQIVLPSGVNANIGRRSGGYYFIGTIDEARIYSRALSAAEIQTDMNTPIPQSFATVNPTSLDFGYQAVNTTSAPQTVTLTNTGSAGLTVTGATISGSGSASYTQSSNCITTLAPNQSCTFNISFDPLASGTQSGLLMLTDNASDPHTVSLTGIGSGSTLSLTPGTATLTPILTQQFTASSPGVSWSVDGTLGGSTATGTITSAGLYTPPSTAGSHTVTATTSDGTQSANATVYVSTYSGTYTRDVTLMRLGLNSSETVLTPNNVNQARFGKQFTYALDGVSDASPLYVPDVSIPGQGAHNVVFVATEHDSVFAFDADGLQSTPLWQDSFINPANGITTVPPNDTGECCDISPEIGITGSPTIDRTTNTLYVVAKTKEVSGSTVNYVHRLHALDITTGAEKFGGPVVISASVPGTGAGSSGGRLPFLPLRENQRAALMLSNGVVYMAFGSHGDQMPYHGWVLGYNASTLAQVMVYCTTPNAAGTGAGVWQSGDGLATDSSGNLYFVTGEGTFDANTGGIDYGDTFMKLNPLGQVLDYFTPHDQSTLDANNLDFGSGGVLLLPDQPGAFPHEAITAGKNGTVYVVNRDNFGKYNATNDNQIVQVLPNMFPNGNMATGNFKAPVYWNGNVYFSADADYLKMFSITNGLLSTAPLSQSSWVANYPGATLGLSANGTTNGILWAIQRIGTDPFGNGVTAPGVLHAFDATNLGTELYNSNQAGTRDTLDYTAKWSAPLIADGRVYVSTLSELTSYGLLP